LFSEDLEVRDEVYMSFFIHPCIHLVFIHVYV
jgi:hypothetical protein